MPRALHDFSPIYPTEQVVISFDFSPALAIGEVLTGVPAVSALLVSGTDVAPSSRLIGSPSIAGNFVLQEIGTCQGGSLYNFISTVATSAGQVLIVNAHLPCQAIA